MMSESLGKVSRKRRLAVGRENQTKANSGDEGASANERIFSREKIASPQGDRQTLELKPRTTAWPSCSTWLSRELSPQGETEDSKPRVPQGA